MSQDNIPERFRQKIKEAKEKQLETLVVCQELIDGYSRFNLIRASSVVNCQSALEEI